MQALANWPAISQGWAGGAIFLTHNISTSSNLVLLAEMFRRAAPGTFVAADQEGGDVQRLSRGTGFTDIPSPRAVAARMTIVEAGSLYAVAATEFRAAGFNLNLGPVVDLDDPQSPVIGRYGRAFSGDPAVVAGYARVFIDCFSAAGVGTVLKHFPGQGRCQRDTHSGPVDCSRSWSEDELIPFATLIAEGRAPAIMMSHLSLDSMEGRPASVSPLAIQTLLRGRLGYRGVIVSDDMYMGAVRQLMGPEEAIVSAIAAGSDLVITSASVGDSSLPHRALEAVSEAVEEGRISRRQIRQSLRRVTLLKQRLR